VSNIAKAIETKIIEKPFPIKVNIGPGHDPVSAHPNPKITPPNK